MRQRGVRALVASLAVVLVSLVGTGGPAWAGDGPGFSAGPDGGGGNSATLGGSQSGSSSSGSAGTPSSPGSSGSGSSNPGSGPPAAPGLPDLLPGVPSSGPGTGACNPANYPGGYSDDFAVPSPCIQPTDTEEEPEPGEPAAPVITTQMVVDAARVVAPTAPPHVEPGLRSFVNIPNNYWTDAPTVRTSVTVLGTAIALTWTPTSTTWDFGDGATATGEGLRGAGVGAPGAVEHAYARQGSYAISTTTAYQLSFVLPGQGAQTIPLVSTPSAPVTLPVREIQTRVSSAG